MLARDPVLKALKAAIESARAEQWRPLEPGEKSRPHFPLQAYLDEAAMREVWKTVGNLRMRERALSNRFLNDQSLADLIIEVMAALDHAPSA